MSEENVGQEPEETEAAEVEAHSAGAVLGLQELKTQSAPGYIDNPAFSCSSCYAASCQP